MRDEAGVDLGQVRVERKHLDSNIDMSVKVKFWRCTGRSFIFMSCFVVVLLALRGFFCGLLLVRSHKRRSVHVVIPRVS